MSLPSRSIRRPVTTLMFYIGVLLFGMISLNLLSRELFPPISYPQLSIVTPYENAAPEEIETLITKPIEEAVGGISGLRKVRSTSKEGLSLVVAEFMWNQNMDFASLAVREKIDLIKERLPRDAQEPIVIKFNPFELPVMSISISSAERTPVQIREVARRWFKDELEKIRGVASASISGGTEEQILVDVDQAKLKAAGVSIVDVSDAIGAANLNFPGGTIKESFFEYLVRTLGEFKHVDEIGQIPIKNESTEENKPNRYGQPSEEPSNRLVLLKDVADIQRTVKERSSFSRFNSLENVTIAVQKQAQANTIQVTDAIKKKLQELKEQLPKDIKIDIVDDQSKFINGALSDVADAAWQGALLAFLVLFIFLRDFKNSALVVTITPITVLWTFSLMYFMKISLNMISLGGVALGVGMLLDNAVVVIENVYRKYRENTPAGMKEAASIGSEEVMAPMVASTLTTVSVFLPIVFVTGIAGQLFKELAWVVVVTQILSAIIAFTLLPMLIAKIGEKSSLTKRDIHDETAGQSISLWDRIMDLVSLPIKWIERTYAAALPHFIQMKLLYLPIVFLLFVGSVWMFMSMDKVLLPKVDQKQFMVKLDMPVGTRVDYTNEITKRIEKFLRGLKEVKNVATVVGSSKGDSTKEVVERLSANQAQLVINLKEESEKSTDELVQGVREYFEIKAGRQEIQPGRISYVLYDNVFGIGSENDSPIVLDVKGPNLDQLKNLALQVQEKISTIPGVYGVNNSLAEPFPETKVIINKDRASFYRLSVVSIAQAANIAIKGITSSKFKEEGREIDIRVQLKERDRDQFQKLGQLMIHSPLDLNVPLSDFVTFKRGKGPSEIKRISQERTVQVYAKVYKRKSQEVVTEVLGKVNQVRIPDRYSIKLSGESEETRESLLSLWFALTLSVILVYMIMAAQFESLWQPFLIMFCLPLSVIGVTVALYVTHTPVSIVVALSMILLAGIVVNNGIILIDFINQLRREGLTAYEATVHACQLRLRPILMTAFSSAVGALPLAMAKGEGALQAPLGITTIGGILIATFLTLLVIPSIYMATVELGQKFKK